MPIVLPRRQTTSQFRPVRASRENASRSFAGSTLGSSTLTLAPVAGQILHHAWARGKAALKGDPSGLMDGSACFPLLGGCGHFKCS